MTPSRFYRQCAAALKSFQTPSPLSWQFRGHPPVIGRRFRIASGLVCSIALFGSLTSEQSKCPSLSSDEIATRGPVLLQKPRLARRGSVQGIGFCPKNDRRLPEDRFQSIQNFVGGAVDRCVHNAEQCFVARLDCRGQMPDIEVGNRRGVAAICD